MADDFHLLVPGKGVSIPSSGGAKAGPATPAPDHAAFLPILTALNSPHAGSKHSETKPEVTLQRDGDRVTQIRIRCGCGQVIELGCEY